MCAMMHVAGPRRPFTRAKAADTGTPSFFWISSSCVDSTAAWKAAMWSSSSRSPLMCPASTRTSATRPLCRAVAPVAAATSVASPLCSTAAGRLDLANSAGSGSTSARLSLAPIARSCCCAEALSAPAAPLAASGAAGSPPGIVLDAMDLLGFQTDLPTHTKHDFIHWAPHTHTLPSRIRDFFLALRTAAIRRSSGARRASAPCSFLCCSKLSQLLSWAKLPSPSAERLGCKPNLRLCCPSAACCTHAARRLR